MHEVSLLGFNTTEIQLSLGNVSSKITEFSGFNTKVSKTILLFVTNQ